MGDTRPPEAARIPEVEQVRLRTARLVPESAREGELMADILLLLRVLDLVLRTHNRRGCCTQHASAILREERITAMSDSPAAPVTGYADSAALVRIPDMPATRTEVRTVPDHEVLLVFSGDEDAEFFRTWLHEAGWGAFGRWLDSKDD